MPGPSPLQDRLLDCTDEQTRKASVDRAAGVVREGKVVVLPTDTVYGVGADAFDVVAVSMVLAAKRRGREMPPPVLVPSARTVDGLAIGVPMYARMLMRQFWPGPLTIVLQAQPSLHWDLGETNGTVALRMPEDEVALALLEEVGPMAVTSANVTGQPAATTAQEAMEQLGGAVTVYLDGGERTGGAPSTIVDCTSEEPVMLRVGALTSGQLREVLGTTRLHESPDEAARSREAAGSAEDAGRQGPDAGADAEPGPEQIDPDDASQDPAPGSSLLIGSVTPSGVRVPQGALRRVPAPTSLPVEQTP